MRKKIYVAILLRSGQTILPTDWAKLLKELPDPVCILLGKEKKPLLLVCGHHCSLSEISKKIVSILGAAVDRIEVFENSLGRDKISPAKFCLCRTGRKPKSVKFSDIRLADKKVRPILPSSNPDRFLFAVEGGTELKEVEELVRSRGGRKPFTVIPIGKYFQPNNLSMFAGLSANDDASKLFGTGRDVEVVRKNKRRLYKK